MYGDEGGDPVFGDKGEDPVYGDEWILCIGDLLQTRATVYLKKILLFYMYFYSTFALQCILR